MATFKHTVNGVDKLLYAFPSAALVKSVEITTRDEKVRKATVLERMKKAIKIYLHGLSRATLGAEPNEVGLDEVIDNIQSTSILHQLDVPEPLIKFQASGSPGMSPNLALFRLASSSRLTSPRLLSSPPLASPLLVTSQPTDRPTYEATLVLSRTVLLPSLLAQLQVLLLARAVDPQGRRQDPGEHEHVHHRRRQAPRPHAEGARRRRARRAGGGERCGIGLGAPLGTGGERCGIGLGAPLGTGGERCGVALARQEGQEARP
jgi:hypothetical protein